jgi:hypothetical protein
MGKIVALEHLKASAQKSRKYFDNRLGNIVGTVADAIEEVANTKADAGSPITITIPQESWTLTEDSANYPYQCDIVVDGVTENDMATITITPDSVYIASNCGICPTSETISGAVRLRSASAPETDIEAQCWISVGKEGI